MSNEKEQENATGVMDDREIGYGKPPRASQFKKGKSGNFVAAEETEITKKSFDEGAQCKRNGE